MRKYITNYLFLFSLSLLFFACSEDLLDKTPLDSYSDPLVWENPDLASRYLNAIIDEVPNGWNKRGHHYATGPFAREHTYLKGGTLLEYDMGVISPDAQGLDRGHLNWWKFSYIQRLNYFIENVDKLPDADSAKRLRGEALFLRALYYSEICRSYGGVPLFDKANQLGDQFSGIERATFEETIDFIAKDCDEAAQLLGYKDQSVLGRPTKEAALALKSRMLLFAASDLTADGQAPHEFVGYSAPDRTALWTAARDAAKAVIDLGTCELSDFGAPNQQEVAQKYFEFFKAYTLEDKEVIWGRMFRSDIGFGLWTNRWCGPNGLNCWGNNAPYGNMADEFEMSDGSKLFDHFSLNENKEYVNTSTTFNSKNIYTNREPRFYASLLYDSAQWQQRPFDLQAIDPSGIYDRRTRITIENGVEVEKRFGLDTRQGPVSPQNAPYTGYLIKKMMDDEIKGVTERNKNIVIWIRYAEILLNYAEASLELGETEVAETYINMVRNRAGLPNLSGDIKTALRHERRIEFCFENIRWYDERRWKTLEDNFAAELYGVDITETTEDGETHTVWHQVYAAPMRTFHEKLYWIPIPRDEINRAPELVQNPFYE
ncbi:RagB/SusD family nutrient uptake outer membrane protein [Sunxiuqinia elliptica]|uniref:Putative outer membrane starch-binding protein n=1 Tax=Sunxiuqinia elliptica TaxID=655355 RepID=A0A4R6GYR8_9BACT|nr:RagB/SusD family nutrient uptake outer membrane protein [Sunxiuqinia elliptica]TDO00015.1 putative outer membrane starch-binding protein [Sunxiuqinia elliptica]TDO57206.1 putative outer membrane starch-binding protein [Sunxiuqinia elliptica]